MPEAQHGGRVTLETEPAAPLRPVGFELVGLGGVLEGHDLDEMVAMHVGTDRNGVGVLDGGGLDELEESAKEGVRFGIGIYVEF